MNIIIVLKYYYFIDWGEGKEKYMKDYDMIIYNKYYVRNGDDNVFWWFKGEKKV